MRLGKIKQILSRVTNDASQIKVDHEAIFGGQATVVNNYNDLIEAYKIIDIYEWNDVDSSQIKTILDKFKNNPDSVQMEQVDFNNFISYFNGVNAKYPIFYRSIQTIVQDQEEQIINVKLPGEINDLEQLSKLNIRLSKLFKLFNHEGKGYKLVGFDTGSEWYEILIIGSVTYKLFITGLDIAKKYFETRESYFKSKTAELDYRAGLANKEDYSDKQFQEYKENRMELELKEEIKKITDKIDDLNGETKGSFESKILAGVKDLVKELGEGTEFHLSLNPPEYATENRGELELDYSKIQELLIEENKMEVKQLPNKKSTKKKNNEK